MQKELAIAAPGAVQLAMRVVRLGTGARRGTVALFEKKKKDDLEALAEEISPSQPWAAARAVADSAVRDRGRPALPEPAPEYGIDKAVELMRQLPEENIELVVAVVKTTLQSLGIDISSIINDGTRKQNEMQARIEVLRREIAGLENEINARRAEIGSLDAERRETALVKDRLSLAEKSNGAPLDQTAALLAATAVPPPVSADDEATKT
jgi:hypothetical protein